MTDDTTIGKCSECGSEVLWAWYPQYERQTIEVWIKNGVVNYDYGGITDSSGEPGEDDSYLCGGCGRITDTIYEMVGLLPTHEFLERALTGLERDLLNALNGVQHMAFQDKPWWPEACALLAKMNGSDSRIRESFFLAWDQDPDNPNPHAYALYPEAFETFELAEARGDAEVIDEDGSFFETGFVIVEGVQ